ncbi:hypothetical protein C8R46DRAFT_1185611 [Mycena filopes]|nr:hypothetical protein C8R46DRAFT_1185611 [Mycena filopes]
MSWATPFLGAATPLDFDGFPDARSEGKDGEGYQEDEYTPGWIRIRALTHRESETLGMWSASLKVMAGTQHLLPTIPNTLPLSHSPYHPYPRLHASHDSRPSAPPASPQRLRERRTEATHGVLHDASAVCSKIMHLAQTLERRTNAERRLTRKKRRRPPLASVVRPAAASTVTAVGDSIPCRATTVRPPRPAPPTSLHLVGLLSDVPPSAPSAPSSPLAAPVFPRTYVDAGTETNGPATSDVAIDAPPRRVFADASVGRTADDHNTTYGVVEDAFARDLALLLPWSAKREQKLAQTIWLDDWKHYLVLFEQIPPFLRVYLHALLMFFRPGAHPGQTASIPPAFAPVFNLFAHWWSHWNAIQKPGHFLEPDIRHRYFYLTHEQLRQEAPLGERGYIMVPVSTFSRSDHHSWLVRDRILARASCLPERLHRLLRLGPIPITPSRRRFPSIPLTQHQHHKPLVAFRQCPSLRCLQIHGCNPGIEPWPEQYLQRLTMRQCVGVDRVGDCWACESEAPQGKGREPWEDAARGVADEDREIGFEQPLLVWVNEADVTDVAEESSGEFGVDEV